MEIRTIVSNGTLIAVINSSEPLITDAKSALDLMMSVQYETGSSRIVLNQEAIAKEFFILSTRLAGEVLQKFVNYHIKAAIIGDFSSYTSKPLQDFIRETNKGNDVYFVSNEAEAIKKLAQTAGDGYAEK